MFIHLFSDFLYNDLVFSQLSEQKLIDRLTHSQALQSIMSHELVFTLTTADGKSKEFSLLIDEKNKVDSFRESLNAKSMDINNFILGKDVG